MKTTKVKIISAVFFCSLTVFLQADVSEKSEFEAYQKAQKKEFANYMSEQDKEFLQYLKGKWKPQKAQKSKPKLPKPKPKKLPIAKPKPIPPQIIKKSPIVKPKPIPKIKPKPKLIPAQKPQKPKIKDGFMLVEFDFYNYPVSLQIDKQTKHNSNVASKENIINYFKRQALTNYKEFIKQIKVYKNSLNLNDWALYQLVHKSGQEIHKNSNLANLHTWFVLHQMGYRVKLGYTHDQIVLIAKTAHELYSTTYFGYKEYALLPSGRSTTIKKLTTYKDKKHGTKELDFTVISPMELEGKTVQKPIKWSYKGKQYQINASYSKGLVNLHSTMPQSDFGVYFSSKNSTLLRKSLLAELQSLIEGKSEIEAVNFLLAFCQKAFKYKTDSANFGREKVMFPEETINSEYSDCEDRAIMFAYLVKQLLGMDVVGIWYDNHLSTAVALSTAIKGDVAEYKGRFYTMADPTFIDAHVGMTMPNLQNKKYKIVKIH